MLLPPSTLWLSPGVAVVWLFVFSAIGRTLRAALGAASRRLIHFDNLIAGIVSFVSVYAIIRTGCRTMLLPVPLMLCFAMRSAGVHPDEPQRRPPVQAILGVGVLLLAGIFFAQGLYPMGREIIPYPATDLNFYCRLARHLQQAGVENDRLDLPAGMATGASLYHWGDEWLLADISRLSNIREEAALLLIVYPLLAAAFALGLYEFFETHWKRRKWLLAGICGLSLFAFMMPEILPAALQKTYAPFSASVMQFPKQLLPGVLILWIAGAVRRADWGAAFALSAVSGLLFINILPAILLSGLWLLWRLWRRRMLGRKVLLAVCFCVLSAGITMLFLYGRSARSDVYLPPALADFWGSLRMRPHILMQSAVQYLALLPLGILVLSFLYLSRKGERLQWTAGDKIAGIYVLVLTICGALSWSLLYPLSFDCQQFFHNVVHPAVPFAVVWCATLYFNTQGGKWFGILLCGALCCCAVRDRRFSRFPHMTGAASAADVSRIEAFFARNPRGERLPCVSYLADSSGTVLGRMRHATTNFYPLEVLSMLYRGYTVYSLNPVYFPEKKGHYAREERDAKWLSPIMQFAHRQEMQNSNAVVIQKAFIKAIGAKYLIINAGLSVPGYLQDGLVDSLRLQSLPYTVYRIE